MSVVRQLLAQTVLNSISDDLQAGQGSQGELDQ